MVRSTRDCGSPTRNSPRRPRHRRTHRRARRVAPAALVEAADAEWALVATVERDLHRFPGQKALLLHLRADHAAHAAALEAAIHVHTGAPPKQAAAAAVTGHLIDTERKAALAAARRATNLRGADAALLASIAACEASHVELLR